MNHPFLSVAAKFCLTLSTLNSQKLEASRWHEDDRVPRYERGVCTCVCVRMRARASCSSINVGVSVGVESCWSFPPAYVVGYVDTRRSVYSADH